jgi:hypothetical protein
MQAAAMQAAAQWHAHLRVIWCAGALRGAGLKLQVELRVVVAGEGHGLAAVVVPGRELLEPAAEYSR